MRNGAWILAGCDYTCTISHQACETVKADLLYFNTLCHAYYQKYNFLVKFTVNGAVIFAKFWNKLRKEHQ